MRFLISYFNLHNRHIVYAAPERKLFVVKNYFSSIQLAFKLQTVAYDGLKKVASSAISTYNKTPTHAR